MKYFAYGSNMSLKRIHSRIANAKVFGVYLLKGYDLRFHMVGQDASAKCDAYKTNNPLDIIEGVVFEIDSNSLLKLDKIEGVGNGYDRVAVNVVGADGDVIVAMMYVAKKIDESLLPYDWYKKHVVEGAKSAGLSASYIAAIDKVAVVTDPDKNRSNMEVKIYS